MIVQNFISLKPMLPYPQNSLDQFPIDYHICKHFYSMLKQKPSRCKEDSEIQKFLCVQTERNSRTYNFLTRYKKNMGKLVPILTD